MQYDNACCIPPPNKGKRKEENMKYHGINRLEPIISVSLDLDQRSQESQSQVSERRDRAKKDTEGEREANEIDKHNLRNSQHSTYT